MRILLISPLPPPTGGMATWTTQYLDYCRKACTDVVTVNTSLNVGGKASNKEARGFRSEIIRTIHIIRQMRKCLSSSPDVVHLNTSCGKYGIFRDLICAKMSLKRKIPLVTHYHCDVKNYVTGKMQKKALKKLLTLSRKAYALNTASQQMLTDFSNPEKVRIVPNFINEDKISDSHAVGETVSEIVYVGHVCAEKGICEILRAAADLPHIRFTLVGPVYFEIPSELLVSNVTLTGAKTPEQVKKYLKKSDVFLFPSYSEGFSIALLEAMAEGLPIIASDVGANKDMLEDKGGIIIPPKDVTAIINAIRKIESREIRKAMSEWNIRKVNDNYIRDKIMDYFLKAYSEFCSADKIKQENR